MPGGPLEVPGGDAIVPVINKVMSNFDLVVATQDWHPKEHKSFASNHFGVKPFDKIVIKGTMQTLWPDHCIQASAGAKIDKRMIMNVLLLYSGREWILM